MTYRCPPIPMSRLGYRKEGVWHSATRRGDLWVRDIVIDIHDEKFDPTAPSFKHQEIGVDFTRLGITRSDCIYFRSIYTGHYGFCQVIDTAVGTMDMLYLKHMPPTFMMDRTLCTWDGLTEAGQKKIDALYASLEERFPNVHPKSFGQFLLLKTVVSKHNPKARWLNKPEQVDPLKA